MEMEFRRGQFQPAEQQMIRSEESDRTVDDLAKGYNKLAAQLIVGEDGPVLRDEIARFSPRVASKEGSERLDELGKLASALKLRRPGVFEYVPEDEADYAAFALALISAHSASLQ